jgi:hypothetical protein
MAKKRRARLADTKIQLPLYEELWRLDEAIRQRFPAENGRLSGVNSLGIQFSPMTLLANGEYWCTPLNTLAFAYTGGDGEHYSFLVRKRCVDSTSPIVLTAPSSDNHNLIVAPDFETFLRAGLSRSFFGLSQFAYARERTLEAFGSSRWTASTEFDERVGYVPDAFEVDVMQFVATSLNLQPFWYSPEKYTEYQASLSLLEMSEDYLADME